MHVCMRFRAHIFTLLLLGCTTADSEPNPLERPPIDTVRIGSVDEISRWAYRRSAEADLDGDGSVETVTLVSDVTLQQPSGRPLWEDGHRWGVFVEDGETKTILYGAFVPNGFVECAIGIEESDGTRPVLVLERSPVQLRVMDIAYRDGQARLRSDGHYQIGQWLPDSAMLR